MNSSPYCAHCLRRISSQRSSATSTTSHCLLSTPTPPGHAKLSSASATPSPLTTPSRERERASLSCSHAARPLPCGSSLPSSTAKRELLSPGCTTPPSLLCRARLTVVPPDRTVAVHETIPQNILLDLENM
ncbi:hypothetical protein TIFTF001_052895 [Ficus carica]|uniref:Uncharacterized protein n=1 Tax=Ficus carica TaxID=3494 RepID=A0AA88ELX7_FICCA|nr:hypothetical protein TIFTF001_052895 [Ficus carica]